MEVCASHRAGTWKKFSELALGWFLPSGALSWQWTGHHQLLVKLWPLSIQDHNTSSLHIRGTRWRWGGAISDKLITFDLPLIPVP